MTLTLTPNPDPDPAGKPAVLLHPENEQQRLRSGDSTHLHNSEQISLHAHLHTCTPAHLHTCTPAHLHTCTPAPQAWVDIKCITAALKPFLTPTSSGFLQEAQKPLLVLEKPQDQVTLVKPLSWFSMNVPGASDEVPGHLLPGHAEAHSVLRDEDSLNSVQCQRWLIL